MKLVQILARELKEWPDHASYAEQDHDREVRFWPGSTKADFFAKELADEDVGFSCKDGIPWAGQVTRAQWEAEKARIAGKVESNADDDGWQRSRGRKPKYEELPARKMQVRHRDKSITDGWTTHSWNWDHEKLVPDADIMAFRIENIAGKPAEQPAIEPAVVENVQAFNAQAEMLYDPVAQGPLQWRDRIYELDTQRAEVEATYQRQIGEIDGEREELVRRLASEGLALVERVQPVEDMSDWRNWKVGDFLSYAKDSYGFYVSGDIYAIQSIKGERLVIDDKTGDKDHAWDADVVQSSFKWHSRPAP